ncbi:hypothetical protein V8C42DRAFT_356099 [Trichoderma barbatum]
MPPYEFGDTPTELSWHLLGVSPVTQSYEEARRQCISKVQAATAECRRTNLMFFYTHFDIETDFNASRNCLYSLDRDWLDESSEEDNDPILRVNNSFNHQLDSSTYPFDPPKSVHRVSWIFQNPQFMADSSSGYGVKQGVGGNCWWVAAVATIANRRDIMEKICVARDEACGVYGFVFHKDGGWISTVVDDNLYLSEGDFNCDDETQKQTNSKALHFAKCSNENETWLPLLEKAVMIPGNGVLEKDLLWSEILASATPNSISVFGLSVSANGSNYHKNGLITNHTYSVLTATEVTNEVGYTSRLLKIRNPWGENASQSVGEWSGPWMFSIILNGYIELGFLIHIHWNLSQKWIKTYIPSVSTFLPMKFLVEITEPALAVFVLSQADSRYFADLQGRFSFTLQFVLRDKASSTVLCEPRATNLEDRRLISCEIALNSGVYEVIPRIFVSIESGQKDPKEVVKKWVDKNPYKLQKIGLQYDLASSNDTFENTYLTYNVYNKEESAVGIARDSVTTNITKVDKKKTDFCSTHGIFEQWNPVCAIGLRVYVRDSDARIYLA